MAVTVTYDGTQNTNKSLGAALSRGKKAIALELNFSGLSYDTSGISVSFVGFTHTLDALMIEQPVSGYQMYWDRNNNVIVIPDLATGVSIASWNSVRAFAWGG